MLRIALFVAVFGACVLGLTFRTDPTWIAYKAAFGKVYSSDATEQFRYEAFLQNMADAALFNEVDPTAVYSWTAFSDRPVTELLTPMPVPRVIPRVEYPIRFGDPLPAAFDWREKGGVTPVKNQGQCGSCWAFCSIATMEGANFITNRRLLAFSDKQLVDCDSNDHGCSGGWPTTAMEWIRTHGGIMLESDYPYEPVQSTCRFDRSKVAAEVKKVYTYKFNKIDEMKKAVMDNGPISVAIDARKFNAYKSGIMNGDNCAKLAPTHGVTVVGWGSEGRQEYWIVKNSWAASWGERGYVRMALGVNACGIEDYPMGCDITKR